MGGSFWEKGAREVGGFFGGLYGPKVMHRRLRADHRRGPQGARRHRGRQDRPPQQGRRQARGGAGREEADGRGPAGKAARGGAGREAADRGRAGRDAPAGGDAAGRRFRPGAGRPANADVLGRAPRTRCCWQRHPGGQCGGLPAVADGYNIIIKVRPTNTASLPVLDSRRRRQTGADQGQDGQPGRPAHRGPADGLGKVGFFEPVMPSKEILDMLTPEARRAVEERFAAARRGVRALQGGVRRARRRGPAPDGGRRAADRRPAGPASSRTSAATTTCSRSSTPTARPS